MTKEQVEKYFNNRLSLRELYAGANYMIDAEDTIWRCEVWASGGIWFIKAFPHESTDEYYRERLRAEYTYNLEWEER